jgi:4'-phosphopantetheinyl transferase
MTDAFVVAMAQTAKPKRRSTFISTRSDTVGDPVVLKSEIHVWLVKLSEDSPVVERAHSVLSSDERERAMQFRSGSLRAAFVVSHGVLRILLGGYCNRQASDLKFGYGHQGKPFLADAEFPIHFNMSHSGEVAAYAFAVGQELGVDIEQHRTFPDKEKIAARFFSTCEYSEFMRIPEQERDVAFFNCWVCKEAYIKARGGGLSIPLDSFQVSVAPRDPARLINVYANVAEAGAWTIQKFTPAPEYSGAVAVRDRRRRVKVHAVRPAHEILQLTRPASAT